MRAVWASVIRPRAAPADANGCSRMGWCVGAWGRGCFIFQGSRRSRVHGQAAFVDCSETTVSDTHPSSSTLQYNLVPVSSTSQPATPLHNDGKIHWNIAIPHDVTSQCSNIWMYESKAQLTTQIRKCLSIYFSCTKFSKIACYASSRLERSYFLLF